MTKYSYTVELKQYGACTTVTRLQDGAVKTFYQAGVTNTSGLISFMNSITDELAESYFPKPKKIKDK